MTFDDVFNNTLKFISNKTNGYNYVLSIGTDSQVTKKTTFITAILIRRIAPSGIGNGAWGCLRKYIVPRRIKSIKEKISIETNLSQEIAFLFDDEKMMKMLDPLIDNGSSLKYEIHLDVGNNGPTRNLIKEMSSRIEGMGIDFKIKPDSYTASSYANRFTKAKYNKEV